MIGHIEANVFMRDKFDEIKLFFFVLDYSPLLTVIISLILLLCI